VSSELELAERALGLGETGDGAQATVIHERSLLLRFARSRPTQATSVDDVTVEVTVVRDGHAASAATNRTDAEALRECARLAGRAAEAAARGSAPGSYPGPPDPTRMPHHDGYDPVTAALDPAQGGAALRTAFAAAARHHVEAAGTWSAGEVTTAIASSSGTRAQDAVTDAYFKVSGRAPSGRGGHAVAAAVGVGGLEPERIAERAAAKAAHPGEPVVLPTGEYPVVLEPAAVGELLAWLGPMAFSGLAYAEGRSALCGRLGARVAAAAVNLADSPRYRGTLPRAFDLEAVPKAPMPLIQDGVAQNVVHDTRSAVLAGARSTGHALAPGGAPAGPLPTNLVLAGGGAGDMAELCRGVERGVYVTRLWYTNPVRPKETLLTGVTRDGTFLIEDGEVTNPLHDMRFTDSVLGLLGRVQALTAAPVLTSEGQFYGRRFAHGVVCPGLRAASLRFTG
jgi:predicted Zn-dependent protease